MDAQLIKPQKRVRSCYDYRECRDYLQQKYGYDERDYAGKYRGNGVRDDVEYLDFWHWVVENHEIHNGCYVVFGRNRELQNDPAWVKKIYSRYLDEFADENGELEMYVWW